MGLETRTQMSTPKGTNATDSDGAVAASGSVATSGSDTADGASADDWISQGLGVARELTVGPFMTGVFQGFASVWLQRRRERREQREAAHKAMEAAKLRQESGGGGCPYDF